MQINGYQIEAEIGRGRTAVVYRARNPQGKLVALKVCLEEDAYLIQQMQREAEVLAWLKHEAVPECYDAFAYEGQQCIVLELISGDDFNQVLSQRDTPFSQHQALEWGLQIADVLSLIHNYHPPHIYGFIAPDHVVLTVEEKIVLIDYGKVAPYTPDEQFPALGLAGYSPPEQYIGKTEPRSDVFSLGVFLYHITTGRDPRVPHAAFLFHVVPPRSLNAALSPDFEALVLRAVEHKASDRFPTIDTMRDALQTCLKQP